MTLPGCGCYDAPDGQPSPALQELRGGTGAMVKFVAGLPGSALPVAQEDWEALRAAGFAVP